MKKSVIILSIIVILSILICGLIFDRLHQQHARCGIVTQLDYEADIITVEEQSGLTWQFFGCEDWAEGDICALLMDDNGTPNNIFDDIIVDTGYCGWIY